MLIFVQNISSPFWQLMLSEVIRSPSLQWSNRRRIMWIWLLSMFLMCCPDITFLPSSCWSSQKVINVGQSLVTFREFLAAGPSRVTVSNLKLKLIHWYQRPGVLLKHQSSKNIWLKCNFYNSSIHAIHINANSKVFSRSEVFPA